MESEKKKQILLQLNQQTIQFIHETFFLQINSKKTFLFFLKKQDTKILQKNNGKKTDCISSKHWKKIIKWIKKKPQIRQDICTLAPIQNNNFYSEL